MNRKTIQCRGCIFLRKHTTKSLIKDTRGEGEEIYLIIPFLIIFMLFVFPAITAKNESVTMSVEGTVTNIEISYGAGDSTLITFNGNETINFRDRIPNIIIGKSYIVTYLHYENGENRIASIQSLREKP